MQTEEQLEQHLLDSIASLVDGIESDYREVLLGALMAVAIELALRVTGAIYRNWKKNPQPARPNECKPTKN